MVMAEITREQLNAYMDDALSDQETSQVELALRGSESLRRMLKAVIAERDRGEHSIGAIWRREHLSCPSREQLGNYLLQVLEADVHDYVEFHLRNIGCPFCLANLADLETRQREPAPKAQDRKRRYFESSAGLLRTAGKK
jgi:hypothetical protein